MQTRTHASGEGVYSESYPSLIDQTRQDIQGQQEVEEVEPSEEDNPIQYEDSEDEADDMSETPLRRRVAHNDRSLLANFFEKHLMRLMGIRV